MIKIIIAIILTISLLGCGPELLKTNKPDLYFPDTQSVWMVKCSSEQGYKKTVGYYENETCSVFYCKEYECTKIPTIYIKEGETK